MSIVHRLEGCGWQVGEVKEPSVDGPVTTAREVAFIHPQSDQVWIVRLPLNVADDLAGQLRGEPPRKHVDIAGAMPPADALQQLHRKSMSDVLVNER